MKESNKIFFHSKPTLGSEEERAVLEVIRSGQIAQGPKVAEFEKLLAEYIGRKFAVAVSSGLSALHLSLISLGVGEGDEVILPSYTCDALLQAVLYTGAKPIIVDVNYNDGNISFDNCLKTLSSRVKAIIMPHNFGFPAEIDRFLELNIPVIEDCAVSIGGIYKGRKLGSFGKISVFSFYATKMITTGEGGMILTDEKEIADEVRELRDYTKHSVFKIRYNYKMTDIEAALGICQMRRLEQFIDQREVLFRKYIELLEGNENIILPSYKFIQDMRPSFYRFIVKLPKYDLKEILNKMEERGIFCGRGVLQPLHKLLEFNSDEYLNAERLAKEVISLPIYPLLDVEDVEVIVENLLDVLRETEI